MLGATCYRVRNQDQALYRQSHYPEAFATAYNVMHRTSSLVDNSYLHIFERARPYLDTRCNDIHTAIAYELAKRLLDCHPDADESIVLPAIILHDVGWKMIPEERQLTAFGPKMTDVALQHLHESEGARIAGEILADLVFDPVKIAEVVTIIAGHDTREMPLSLNDKLVKDADKLWRFTRSGFNIDLRRFGVRREEHVAWLEAQVDSWMLTSEAKRIAWQCLLELKRSCTEEVNATPE